MRGFPAIAIAGLLTWSVPAAGLAQDRTIAQSARSAVDGTAGPRRTATFGAENDTPGPSDITRAAEELVSRIQPIEQRLRADPRFRSAGTALGLGAIALGTLRRGSALTFVGTQALRLGLDRQLTQIQNRSGFVCVPSIGYRTIAVTVSRTFDPH